MPNNNRLHLVWGGLARNNRWSELVNQTDINTFVRRSESEGAEFFARALGKFRSSFLTGLGEGKIGTIQGFGTKKNSILPRFLYGAMSQIFTDEGRCHNIVNVDAVACVNQLTAVFTKLKGGHTLKSEVDTIESFIKTEEEIQSTSIDYTCPMPKYYTEKGGAVIRTWSPLESIMDEASRLVKLVLAGSDPREIQPKHGSGVSACGTEVRDRYAVPRFVEKIDKIWPMSEYYYLSPTAFCDGLGEYLDVESYDPCAKVLLVPKDARGPRLISCEPRETMWIQQGLMGELYRTIEGHPLTRRRVNFTRQGYNQLAAYYGSLPMHREAQSEDQDDVDISVKVPRNLSGMYSDALKKALALEFAGDSCLNSRDADYMRGQLALIRRWSTDDYLAERGMKPATWAKQDMAGRLATLDLKDASDRLRLDIVQRLFPRNWADALTACRSERTLLPDGRLVTLRKHAPMGSAVCFPVMALTIWALLTAIAPRHARKSILVYGDDIVVPSFMAADATRVLEAVGLRINVNKSFSRGPFRESCGEEFVYGVRVTPVRLRMNLDDDNESLMAAMAFSNNMLESPSLSDNGWFLDLLKDWYGPYRVPIALQPSRKSVAWLDHVQRLELGGVFRGVTLSGVAFTDDPNRVFLPDGRRTRLHGRNARADKPAYHIRQYSIVVPVPSLVEYETGDWCHVLRSLTEKSNRKLGLDAVHNRIRFKRRWVSVD